MTDIAGLQKAISDIMQKAAEGNPGGDAATLQDDIARLQNALKPDGSQSQTQTVEGAEGIKEAAKTEGGGPGNRILDTVESLRHTEKMAVELQEMIGKIDTENMTPGEAFQLQMQMQDWLLRVEFSGKVVNKGTQSAETLQKGQ